MVVCGGCWRPHTPEKEKDDLKIKCWVINTHLRICTTSFPSTITIAFPPPQNLFYPECLWASEILHLHIWEALSHSYFQVIIDRGESSEAGGSSVLSSWCPSSVALIRLVILCAKEINPAKKILLMLTFKTKHPPPPNQNVQAKSSLFTDKPKSPQRHPCEACII